MNNKEIIEAYENAFETTFLKDADNPEHIRVLYEALERLPSLGITKGRLPFKWIQTSGTGLRDIKEE